MSKEQASRQQGRSTRRPAHACSELQHRITQAIRTKQGKRYAKYEGWRDSEAWRAYDTEDTQDKNSYKQTGTRRWELLIEARLGIVAPRINPDCFDMMTLELNEKKAINYAYVQKEKEQRDGYNIALDCYSSRKHQRLLRKGKRVMERVLRGGKP